MLTLEKMWTYDGNKRGRLATDNIISLMLTITKPLAPFLVIVGNVSAATPFIRYNLKEGGVESAHAQLKRLMNECPDAAAGPLKGAQKAVKDLIDICSLY